ncbi:hypothetical protein H5410_016753 [Solanum commersonii]|uniref:Uncharacterized protein n=1 Tax=Solanum commersonii TaxID=4109 RepID=A0A9J5ZXD4_SOLCO|nr:hypothetical protein H5410_016753 [Solanum commersonii]
MTISATSQSSLVTSQSIPLTSHDHFPNLTHKTHLTTSFCSDKDPNNLPNEPVVQNDDTIRFKEGKYAALLKPSCLNAFA